MNTRKHDDGGNKNSLSLHLNEYRLRRLLTIKQISNMSGVSVGTVVNVLRGNYKRKHHDLTVERIKRAFPDLQRIAG